ncbi:hypothetical protein B0H19DRAFT_1072040 [Mycena capillaripes]|nr:hypothetical protein B0H19DRAFT_1072040 [Mycena capillaripes]
MTNGCARELNVGLAPESDHNPIDKTYKPLRNHPAQSEEDTDSPEEVPQPKKKEKAKKQDTSAAKKSSATAKKTPTKKLEYRQAADSDDDSEPSGDEDAPVTKSDRNPKKGRMGDPVWRWKYIPDEASFEAFEVADTRPVPVASMSNVSAQRQTMTKFIQDEIEHPAVVITKRGFWKYLVEGMAMDDLSFSFPRALSGGHRRPAKKHIRISTRSHFEYLYCSLASHYTTFDTNGLFDRWKVGLLGVPIT